MGQERSKSEDHNEGIQCHRTAGASARRNCIGTDDNRRIRPVVFEIDRLRSMVEVKWDDFVRNRGHQRDALPAASILETGKSQDQVGEERR